MPRVRPILAIVAAALIAAPLPIEAATLACSKPIKPLCIELQSTYESALKINRCKTDIKAYMEKVNSYVSCLQDLADETKKAATAFEQAFEKKSQQDKQNEEKGSR